MENYNSSELARKVAEKLGWDEARSTALYKELSQIPDNLVKTALAAFVEPEVKVKYVACVKESCVRDAQMMSEYKEELFEEEEADGAYWTDAEGPLFLQIVEAESPTRAVQIVAAQEGVDESLIELYRI